MDTYLPAQVQSIRFRKRLYLISATGRGIDTIRESFEHRSIQLSRLHTPSFGTTRPKL
jgi:hypothetical protein